MFFLKLNLNGIIYNIAASFYQNNLLWLLFFKWGLIYNISCMIGIWFIPEWSYPEYNHWLVYSSGIGTTFSFLSFNQDRLGYAILTSRSLTWYHTRLFPVNAKYTVAAIQGNCLSPLFTNDAVIQATSILCFCHLNMLQQRKRKLKVTHWLFQCFGRLVLLKVYGPNQSQATSKCKGAGKCRGSDDYFVSPLFWY